MIKNLKNLERKLQSSRAKPCLGSGRNNTDFTFIVAKLSNELNLLPAD